MDVSKEGYVENIVIYSSQPKYSNHLSRFGQIPH